MASSRSIHSARGKVEDRLIKSGYDKERKIEEKRVSIEEDHRQNNNNYTPRIMNKDFNQRVADQAREYHRSSLQEQVEDGQGWAEQSMARSSSAQNIEAFNKYIEVSQSATEKPKKTIAEKQKDRKEFHQRQKNFLETKEQNVQNIQKTVYSRKTSNYKFTPKIDDKSRKMVQMPFTARLEIYHSKEKEKHHAKTTVEPTTKPKLKKKTKTKSSSPTWTRSKHKHGLVAVSSLPEFTKMQRSQSASMI